MKQFLIIIISIFLLQACSNQTEVIEDPLATLVKKETLRSWKAYKQYAWGDDVLLPLSKKSRNWYSEPLYISPIDAYSTLKVMGFEEEAKEIENYVVDSLDFDKDIFVKVFEVNIRVLGGLLSMYHYTGEEAILNKAVDFADRMLPAFESGTGIPHYWVNLKTGAVKGDTVNVAEAGSYMFEMGILSYYANNPLYYQKAKAATMAVFNRKSDIGLVGERIDIETGEWTNINSHICAGMDSYFEYMFKSLLIFNDPDIKAVWEQSIVAINTYLPEVKDDLFWYKRVDMNTGEKTSAVITLYDAFMPGLLVLSGDTVRAEKLQNSWNWLWNKYGLEPMVYDYDSHTPNYPVYDLNPEIIESAYYLYHFTGDKKYRMMAEKYFNDIMTYCRTEVAFSAIENVETKEKRDYMATYFFAETLKYFYLIFEERQSFKFEEHYFSTEAHTFRRDAFDGDRIMESLGINPK